MSRAEFVEDTLEKLLEEHLDVRIGQSGEERSDVIDEYVAFLHGGERIALQKARDLLFTLFLGGALGQILQNSIEKENCRRVGTTVQVHLVDAAAEIGRVEEKGGSEEVDESVVVTGAEMVVQNGIFENVQKERFSHRTLTDASKPCWRLRSLRNKLISTRGHHNIRQLT